jgi:hypothetical protein
MWRPAHWAHYDPSSTAATHPPATVQPFASLSPNALEWFGKLNSTWPAIPAAAFVHDLDGHNVEAV